MSASQLGAGWFLYYLEPQNPNTSTVQHAPNVVDAVFATPQGAVTGDPWNVVAPTSLTIGYQFGTLNTPAMATVIDGVGLNGTTVTFDGPVLADEFADGDFQYQSPGPPSSNIGAITQVDDFTIGLTLSDNSNPHGGDDWQLTTANPVVSSPQSGEYTGP